MQENEIDDYIEAMRQSRRAKGPLHHFPDMDDSERLSYEQLSSDNCEQLVLLFKDELENPFIDKRFKSIEGAKQYAQDTGEARFDSKHGGCDFLIRLKDTTTYIGVLHLFDYSLETFSDIATRCTIGFAIAAPFRRHYYATESIHQLMKYAYQYHNKTTFLAYTPIQNEPSNALLLSLDMTLENEEYHYGDDNDDNYYVCRVGV
jgi:RimJ/RimL family protein N-acetyltransferase